MEIHRVAVVGSGQMGTGVAQITACAGFETVLLDGGKPDLSSRALPEDH